MEPMKHTVKLENLPEGWNGSIVMDAPLHTDRLKYIAESGLHRVASKKLKGDAAVAAAFDEQLPGLLKIYDRAKELVRAVNITGPQGEVISTLDDFDRHPATEQCWAEVAVAYLQGFGPGKKKS